jgi:Uncharacterized protein conserved in bacteria
MGKKPSEKTEKTEKTEKNENAERISELARNVIQVNRNQLLINLRFLDAALSRPKWVQNELFPLATNGRYIFYEPVSLLKEFRKERSVCVRKYLHVLMHCIFRHMFVRPTFNRDWWNVACDIAVEYSITCLGLDATETSNDSRQKLVFMSLRQKLGKLTAEKIYHYYEANPPSDDTLDELAYLFGADDHTTWYIRGKGAGEENVDGDSREQNSPDSDKQSQKEGSGHDDDHDDGNDSEENGQSQSDEEETDLTEPSREDLEKDWKDISERMQMEMENFAKGIGKDPGAFIQNLREVNREKYDYTSFLKKFAVTGEVMKVNPDEFDYVYYTYGLDLYENMPLIEPLEYREVKRIREFVIAIDTSCSITDEQAQDFVQKTFNILKSTESFFSKINVRIIQCDTEIHEEVKITSQEEFDDYLAGMKLKGRGGTDFRPVFRRVDELIAQKEFTNLRGIVYFTDGFGPFPSRMPAYTTAVILHEVNVGEDVYVPNWAIKVVLNDEELKELKNPNN